LDADDDSLDSYYDPVADLNIHFMGPFHQYLLLVSRAEDGLITLHRLPDVNPLVLHDVDHLRAASGAYPYASPFTDGCMFAIHGSRLYFTSGWHAPGAGTELDVYGFDGTRVEWVARLRDLPDEGDVRSAGLLVWQEELLFWFVRSDSTSQEIRMVMGDDTISFLQKTATHSNYSAVYSLGGELVLVCKSGSDEGFYHTAAETLSDGHFISSKHDFGFPGRLKRLEQITAILDGNDADFDVVLKYRTDDASSWTTAATVADTRVAKATGIGARGSGPVTFNTLEVRVDVVDGSGSDLDYAIEGVSVLYSADEGTRWMSKVR
jgi:hypothetical protein